MSTKNTTVQSRVKFGRQLPKPGVASLPAVTELLSLTSVSSSSETLESDAEAVPAAKSPDAALTLSRMPDAVATAVSRTLRRLNAISSVNISIGCIIGIITDVSRDSGFKAIDFDCG